MTLAPAIIAAWAASLAVFVGLLLLREPYHDSGWLADGWRYSERDEDVDWWFA